LTKRNSSKHENNRPGFDYSARFVGQGHFNDCSFEINGVPTPTQGWLDDVSTDFAIQWMKQNHDQPFSMVVGFKSPHSPCGFRKGLVVDEMVLNIDLAPTLLDLAGVPAPSEMQGASWKPLASGSKPANWRQSFLAQYFYENGGGDTPTIVGVRAANAKLVKYEGHDEWTEVFDLAVDPYELKNLAADPAAVAKLSAEFDAQVKATNYAVPPDADKPPSPVAKQDE
jgi:hypothetical protein